MTGLALKPCPFCGSEIKHVESWARSFDPPRLYHEWHHVTDNEDSCPIRAHIGKIVTSATDDVEMQEMRIARWNTRATAPASEGVRDPAQSPLIEALVKAEAAFEYVRLALLNHLDNPERLAFWRAVEARDAIRATLANEPAASWECAGRKQSLPEPGECDWPVCGCDPQAIKVVENLMEQGWIPSFTSNAREGLNRHAQQERWQPIETAPKDGTWFAACQDGETYPCEWREEQSDEGRSYSGWFDLFNLSFEEPTLWHPIAALPSTECGEGK